MAHPTNTPPDNDFLVYDFAAFQTNDPTCGVKAVTTQTIANVTIQGDVWMVWFKVLDELLSGSSTRTKSTS